jgi:hypothetical protein
LFAIVIVASVLIQLQEQDEMGYFRPVWMIVNSDRQSQLFGEPVNPAREIAINELLRD